MLAHEEVACNLQFRRHREVQHRCLETVLGISLSILVDSCGVAQLPVVVVVVGQGLAQVRLRVDVEVLLRETAGTRLVVTIAVSTHEGALHVSQERRSDRRTLVITLGRTVVTDVACLVSKRSIEANRQFVAQ